MALVWGWTFLSVITCFAIVRLLVMLGFLTISHLAIATLPDRVFSGSAVHCVLTTTNIMVDILGDIISLGNMRRETRDDKQTVQQLVHSLKD